MFLESFLLHKLKMNHDFVEPMKAKNGTRSQVWVNFCALDSEPVDCSISIPVLFSLVRTESLIFQAKTASNHLTYRNWSAPLTLPIWALSSRSGLWESQMDERTTWWQTTSPREDLWSSTPCCLTPMIRVTPTIWQVKVLCSGETEDNEKLYI